MEGEKVFRVHISWALYARLGPFACRATLMPQIGCKKIKPL